VKLMWRDNYSSDLHYKAAPYPIFTDKLPDVPE
jgi:hypothetical protein